MKGTVLKRAWVRGGPRSGWTVGKVNTLRVVVMLEAKTRV